MASTPLICPRVNLTKKPCLTMHFVLLCSFYFLLHFISLRSFTRKLLEIRSDSSPRMPRHSWDIFTVQSSKFKKLGLLTKKPKSTKKMGKCSNSKNVLDNITPFVNSQFIYRLSIHNITAESKTAFMHWSSHAQSRQEFFCCKPSLSTFRIQ